MCSCSTNLVKKCQYDVVALYKRLTPSCLPTQGEAMVYRNTAHHLHPRGCQTQITSAAVMNANHDTTGPMFINIYSAAIWLVDTHCSPPPPGHHTGQKPFYRYFSHIRSYWNVRALFDDNSQYRELTQTAHHRHFHRSRGVLIFCSMQSKYLLLFCVVTSQFLGHECDPLERKGRVYFSVLLSRQRYAVNF